VENVAIRPSDNIRAALQYIGAPENRVIWLSAEDGITASNFDYADLIQHDSRTKCIAAVIEKDGSPLVYLSSSPYQSHEASQSLAQLLGNRGETAILLDVSRSPANVLMALAWPCRLDAHKSHSLDLTNKLDAQSILGDLQEGLWGTKDNAYQEQRLRDLLVRSVKKVSSTLKNATSRKEDSPEHDQEVLGLVGRALFTRFLIDRNILASNTAPELWEYLDGDGATAFNSPEKAAALCVDFTRSARQIIMSKTERSKLHEGYQIHGRV
jgi:hypothetical protein